MTDVKGIMHRHWNKILLFIVLIFCIDRVCTITLKIKGNTSREVNAKLQKDPKGIENQGKMKAEVNETISTEIIKEIKSAPSKIASFVLNHEQDQEWIENVCNEGWPDPVCHEVIVLMKRKVSFCSAAKVASTTTRDYFFKIADGELVVPDNAKYGVHEANWTRFDVVDPDLRSSIITSSEWTHVFFIKHVVERFISGYLDKVVADCARPYHPSHAINFYHQYGFSCEKHQDLEEFVSFMETVPKKEAHFSLQTPLCNVQKFPYTDIIYADKTMSARLEDLSSKLGVKHPIEDKATSKHGTGAKKMMSELFKGKKKLIERILKMFEEDCNIFPDTCNVEELMRAVEE